MFRCNKQSHLFTGKIAPCSKRCMSCDLKSLYLTLSQVVPRLPKMQGTHVYQGWLIQNNTPVSIGLLSVQNGIASVDFPGDITNYQAVAVSMEHGPNASKNAPAGPVVALGQLKHPHLEML